VAPARGWPCCQRAQKGKLGAVQLPDDRQRREAAQGRLVRRSQVVQVEQIGFAGAGAGERIGPSRHQPLVGGFVDRGEDPVGPRRAVLVGGLKGNRCGERIAELERGRVVDGGDLNPGVEAPGVGWIAWLAERAGGERHLPACLGQRPGERAGDLGRAAAREEEQRRADATPRLQRALRCCCRFRLPLACPSHPAHPS
jgi:hypothetical protein